MNSMEQFIEQRVCQEINCLTAELASAIDNSRNRTSGYTDEQKQRIVYNALFDAIVLAYSPDSKSAIANQAYPRYAEQARKYFKQMVQFLREYQPEKFYQ